MGGVTATVYGLAKSGTIGSLRVGYLFRIKPEEVEAYERKQEGVAHDRVQARRGR